MNVGLLLSTQRSGSHFLKAFIESRFPAVVCSGEVLEEPFDKQSPVLPAHPEISRFWSWYVGEAAAGKISAAPNKRIPAFEFYLSKLAWLTQPNDLVIDVKYSCVRSLSGYEDTDHGSSDFTTFIKNKNIAVLHLIRKNILKTLISYSLARQTGVWHRTTEKAPSERLPKIQFDPEKLLSDIKHSDRLTQDYREHFSGYSRYNEIVYEDFAHEQKLQQPRDCLRVLASFLGKKPLESNQSPIWCKKTSPEDPSEIVENWEEIVRVLQDTEYSWMVQTPLLAGA